MISQSQLAEELLFFLKDINGNVYTLGIGYNDIANGSETLTINPVDNGIYDVAGNEASTSQSNNTVSLNVTPYYTASSSLSGTISTSYRLGTDKSPFTLTGNLLIAENAVLSIDPGVTIKMNNDTYILVQGTLIAVGTSSNNIVFDPFGKGLHFDDTAVDFDSTNFTKQN